MINMTLRQALKYTIEDFFDAILYSLLTTDVKPIKEYFSSLKKNFYEIRIDYWKDKTKADDF